MSFTPPLPHFTSRVSKRKKPNTSNVSKFQVDPPIFPSLPTTLERPVTPEIPMNGEEGGEFDEDKGGNFRSPTPLQPQFGRGTGSVFGGDGHDMSPVLNHMNNSQDTDADFMCFTLDLPSPSPNSPPSTEFSSFPPSTSSPPFPPSEIPLSSPAFDPHLPPPTWSSLISSVLNSSINRDADLDYALKGMVMEKHVKKEGGGVKGMRRVVSDTDLKNTVQPQSGSFEDFQGTTSSSRNLFSTPPPSTSSPKKTVTFNETVTVNTFLKHHPEVNRRYLWWSNEDYSVFKQALLFRAHLGFPGEEEGEEGKGRFKVSSI
ncbi:hypothetical protein TrLO_g9334 [Triparma laevis f. longispina]|uniref:Uncharacterized protein n=1 Tax=Triparma laevis f. longispina TaxID=1714387 RepID=A0A9W7DTL3_9STRA|nr:hypothetical protein TrLO_g9334 [Triparma laevis f. longispina]